MLLLALLPSALCVQAQQSMVDKAKEHYKSGIASFYHKKFEGRLTATGEVFANDKYTAASNTHKLGTYVKVTNLNNKRAIDLAKIAAEELNFINAGLTKVKIEPVTKEEGQRAIADQMERRNGSDVVSAQPLSQEG
jgi:rare lipoprotein A